MSEAEKSHCIPLPEGKKLKDLTGERFGSLTVLNWVWSGPHKRDIAWHCRCVCGTEKVYWSWDLTRPNHTKSCGCLRRKSGADRERTHGMTGTPVYRAWQDAKKRCYNRKNKSWKDYGGRGIKVADEWLTSFEKFYKDMGEKPTARHTLERLNVNGNYSPENCVWAIRLVQNNNRRSNKFLTWEGVTLTLAGWARALKVKRSTFYWRVIRSQRNAEKFPMEDAMNPALYA